MKKLKVEMTVVLNEDADVDEIKKWEHHIDYAIDMGEYPEIHHIEDVKVGNSESIDNVERYVKNINGMPIWEVNGIDDLEGTCFAQCSTKEKAEKAMRILEENGFEDMLVVKQSSLRLDQLLIEDKLIQL